MKQLKLINMKKLLIFLFAVSIFASCQESKPVQSHEIQWNEKGKDSVVYVQVPSQNGGFTSFYMNYLLFNSLYRNGGYSTINHYYSGHISDFSNQSRYASYSRAYSPTYHSGTKSNSSFFSKSTSSPSRSSSYKSTPSRSYSSPIRSYSSPSRSYSSPSRPYSSPSRSYSSPSRH